MPSTRWGGSAGAAAALVLLLGGCGGSGKPAYCSARDDLEQSVKGLGDVNLLSSGGLDRLKSKASTVRGDAGKALDAAKSDFPSETSAVRTSAANLESSVRGLGSNPTPSQVAAAGHEAKSLVSAVDDFVQATASKC